MSAEQTLHVWPLDEAPIHGASRQNYPIENIPTKATACKILEEAAEAYACWQQYDEIAENLSRIDVLDQDEVCAYRTHLDMSKTLLVDELSDVIVAVVDLAMLCHVDLQVALDRNKARQVRRGRIHED